MEKFKRVDSFDVTFADSFARPEFKVKEEKLHVDGRVARKGVGEKRIYCGRDEAELNRFFNFDKKPIFFIQKDDLEEYVEKVEKEFLDPSYHFGSGVKETYNLYCEYCQKLNNLQEDRLYLHFSYTYDNQNRYYLVLPKRKKETMADHLNYDFIRDICLPRVTRLCFIKLVDINSGQIYIYLKPFLKYDLEAERAEKAILRQQKQQVNRKTRIGQDKYRAAIFNRYPYCVVTKVTDPDLLIACHIKSYSMCNSKEQYDEFNGFSMTPTIHTLFDLGYLTFNSDGQMVLSDFFRNMDRRCLHLDGVVRVTIYPESQKYLEWHNANIFKRTSRGVDIVE